MTLFDDLGEIEHKAERLLPRKWMTLDAARMYVLMQLVGPRQLATREEREDAVRAIHGRSEETKTEFGQLFAMADGHARRFLVRAFASGDVETRAIEQRPDQHQVGHEPLPWHWWLRIVDRDDNTSAGDAFPFHRL